MYKALNFFANRVLSFPGIFFSADNAMNNACDNTKKETAKIISLQHYIAFSSVDVISREKETTDIQKEAIIISFS
jgi:hypothetical protein